ncbi:MAG: hypothetical protein AAFP78_05085 [Pseudomonadota bacterium]
MTPRAPLWITGLAAAVASAGFAWFMRLPLPFDGFAIVAAAGLAFLATLTLLALAPPAWIWSHGERLRHAFQARHDVPEEIAANALASITTAHDRARALRRHSGAMREDVAARVAAAADRMDAAAREIFYVPERQRELSAVLIRSELIEDAAAAHATLRSRDQAESEERSRAKLIGALDALDAAFDEGDARAARKLLAEVETASEVAETLLAPRSRPMNDV